jgi:hypothetical protein
MKTILITLAALLSASAFAGPHVVNIKINTLPADASGEVRRYLLIDAEVCGAFGSVAPTVTQVGDDALQVAIDLYPANCAKTKPASFNVIDLDRALRDHGLDPATGKVFVQLQ